MNQLPEWVEENKAQILVGLFGLFFMGFGVWQAIDGQMKQDSIVEMVEVVEDESQGKVVVDVSGAVESPGVYEFNNDQRVNDALMRAGGLSADANRDYVSRSINLADKLIDGLKIYIPFKDDSILVVNSNGSGMVMGTQGVSINSASMSELDSLWGVGEVRASQIIENRPYASIEELKSKASIPQNVLDANKDKLSL